MKSINEQRIEEFNEEIDLIDEGIKAYENEMKKGNVTSDVPTYETKRKILDLKKEKKSKTAAALQLGDLINKAEEQLKIEVKDMKENFNKALKNAMDRKDSFPHDHKLQVLGIKNTADNRSWANDEHKVAAYKMLKNLLNQYPNGKSI